DEAYRSAWNRMRSDEPPYTTITFVAGRQSKKFPIHDRWWLSEDGGVEAGTSFGGFGSRVSRIRKLEKGEADAILHELAPYFRRTAREYEGERLDYTSFTL